MNRNVRTKIFAVLLGVLAIAGCSNDVSDSRAPVILVIEKIEYTPTVSVNDRSDEVATTTVLRNQLLNQHSSENSELNDIILDNYRVAFTRTDGGTRVPEGFTRPIPSFIVPAGGTANLFNLPLVKGYQKSEAPLRDLQFTNGGFDRETNKTHIDVRAEITFFGHTIAGDRVSANTALFLEFVNGPIQ